MATKKRTMQRKSVAKPKMVKHELQDAYLLTKETGDIIRQILGEIPSKYSGITPILRVLESSARGNVTIELPEGHAVPTLTNRISPQPIPIKEKEDISESEEK